MRVENSLDMPLCRHSCESIRLLPPIARVCQYDAATP